MRICRMAACVLAVAFGVSPLAQGAPGGSGETGWTNGFDLADGAGGGALPVVAGWTNGHDLRTGSDRSGLLVVADWTNGYDLSSGDEVVSVAVTLK